MPKREVLDVNGNSYPNSGVVDIEETTSGSICTEGVNNGSKVGEVLLKGCALANSGNCAAGIEEPTVYQLSSLRPILIGDEFEQILNLHLAAVHEVIEQGLVIIDPREVFSQNRSGGVIRTDIPVRGVDQSIVDRTRVTSGLQIGQDVGLELGIERFVNEMIAYVVDGSLKLEAMLPKFVDLIRD